MRHQLSDHKFQTLAVFFLLPLLLAACSQGPESCPRYTTVRFDAPEAFAMNEKLPFQFPLEDPESYTYPIMTDFATCGWASKNRKECHAAEDYYGPPGTPVYAIADGELSFSGPMGGYGWLIIIDHPQANLYSLYGHLSPSRWEAEPGAVEKGELIGYLGDPDENGGSAENPLIPHLHFGIRTGQRAKYSGSGEWRWMAGWIAACPQDLGWLQPSVVITNQHIPEGGFQMPAGKFFDIWWFTIVFGGIYLFGWVCLRVYATRMDKPHLLITFGMLYAAGGWVFNAKQPPLSLILLSIALVSISLGIYRVLNRTKTPPPTVN